VPSLPSSVDRVVADAAPYFGHPEIDLTLVDYFQAVPQDVFDAYREIAPIDAEFAQRRNLWCRLSTWPASPLRPPDLLAMLWTAFPAQLATTCNRLYRQARPIVRPA
jgi:fructosamine kinase